MTIKDQKPSEIQIFSDEEQQQLSTKIEKMAGHIQLVMPDSVDEAWQLVVRMEEQALVDTAKRGLLYLSIKSHTEYGEFDQKLKEYGIPRRNAFNAMAVSKMFLALPESKVQTSALLNMNKSKLIEIARLPIETVESLDDDDLETLNDLSVREFRKEIRKLKDKHTDLEDTLAHTINELEHERLRKVPTTRFDMPVFVSEIRKDAICTTELLNDALQQAQAGVTQLVEFRSLDLPARIAAAQVVHHAYASIYTQIGTMLSQLHMEFGEYVQGIENLPKFDDAEWQYVDTERERLLESFRLSKGDK
ncbi:hypothetical protein [Pseudoalteromonas piscicida]|uniref:DUF3102 domain-containing protein n=1 Tax=Pseudoalteromonas piscicida TaxID=43662 RepID=A0A2A5JLX3_PSEO7|nr:hypothetical protein [Pseudoalteromonas piscicida]PCK30438.1 hypothetical protein CEX98_17590 [Pseudoalteromonas piscicida]